MRAFLLALLAAQALLSPTLAHAVVFEGTRVIVRFGDPLPEGAGEFFSLGTAPRISPNGQVVFGAQTSASGVQGSGIFRGSGPSDLVTIALEDWPTPDANGYFPALWHGYTAINANDEVAFWTTLSGALGGAARGVFRGTGGPDGLTKIIRTGDVLPADGGSASPTTDALALNNTGEVAFTASLGVYRGDGTPDGLVKIARSGEDAPGGDGTLGSPNGARLAFNDAGQVAFNATIPGSAAATGIFRGDGGDLEQIARDGVASPDGNGVLIVGLPAMNGGGDVAFFAYLDATTGGTADNAGIFVGDGTSLGLIARRGALTPSGNGRFFDIDPGLAINDMGAVLFFSTITGASGGSNAGLFRGDGEQLVEIARAGDLTPSGQGVLRSFQLPTTTYPPVMALNEGGQVAFTAGIDLENGGAPNDAIGLFLHDDATGLHELVRSGDSLLDLGTVSNITFARGTDNESSGLADDGSVAYGALNAVLVAPEPNIIATTGCAMLALSILVKGRRGPRTR